MSSRTQAISPILRVTKLSFEYDKVFTKEKMKFNNGDEIFTKKLIRSKACLGYWQDWSHKWTWEQWREKRGEEYGRGPSGSKYCEKCKVE